MKNKFGISPIKSRALGGRMEGWMGGWLSPDKDYLQQSKIFPRGRKFAKSGMRNKINYNRNNSHLKSLGPLILSNPKDDNTIFHLSD